MKINGFEIVKVLRNGVEVDKIMNNGVEVFAKSSAPVEREFTVTVGDFMGILQGFDGNFLVGAFTPSHFMSELVISFYGNSSAFMMECSNLPTTNDIRVIHDTGTWVLTANGSQYGAGYGDASGLCDLMINNVGNTLKFDIEEVV